ncbi:MAG: enoyl-CoA hydratase/isomerase family protein [Alphaproteobacteria bacterium]|nr:MAG: enoyl-CoA hydratase/isomerase family protein [Alphaproteobacteria bacterium]
MTKDRNAAEHGTGQGDGDVLFSVAGRLGIITLNRPKALNALTREMCVAIKRQLDAWAVDEAVGAVLIEGTGERAFCAGGDVVRVARSAREGSDEWFWFFHDEYRMNSTIGHFPKPYIALLDGITMGGGFGVSVHGRFRVASERILFAMPETGLGLIPDVGGGHVLPRLPGRVGHYLGLTGYRAKAADTHWLGVATHVTPAARLGELKAALVAMSDLDDPQAVGALLDSFHEDPGPAPLAGHQEAIDRHFAHERVEEVLESLASDDGEWAYATRGELLAKSPTSLKLTAEQLRRGAQLDLDEDLRMEFRIVNRIMTRGHDFFEGVRAILIDKDRQPKWNPARLEDVHDDEIAAYFAPLGERELKLD